MWRVLTSQDPTEVNYLCATLSHIKGFTSLRSQKHFLIQINCTSRWSVVCKPQASVNRKPARTHYPVRRSSLVKSDRAGRDKYVDGTVIRFNKKWRLCWWWAFPSSHRCATPSREVMRPPPPPSLCNSARRINITQLYNERSINFWKYCPY
jgi:hypothetical protein